MTQNNIIMNKITSYVVNVHDALNFDIDIPISNEYTILPITYKYLNSDNILCISNSYRCRLQGINMKNKQKYYFTSFKHEKIAANIDITNIINYCDGWVDVSISRIDMYNRLLVNIYVVINDEIQNLSNYLLEKYPNLYENYKHY